MPLISFCVFIFDWIKKLQYAADIEQLSGDSRFLKKRDALLTPRLPRGKIKPTLNP